jgi:heat shock protein HslJ
MRNRPQSDLCLGGRAIAVHGLPILLGVMVISCGALSPVAPSRPAITNVTWKLHSLQRSNFPKIDIQNPERFTVSFDDDGRAAIRADCNRCVATYELAGQDLRLRGPACTRAYCGSDSLDTEYIRGLTSSPVFSAAQGVLTIESSGLLLTFRQ